MGSGIGSRARRNVWRVSRYGSAGADVATIAATRGSAAAARIAPMAPIEWPTIAPLVTSGRSMSARNAASASSPNSPALTGQRLGRVLAMSTDVDRQAVVARGVEELRDRQGSVTSRLPAVDQGDARSRRTVAGRDEPGGQIEIVGADRDRLERQADISR